MVVIMRVIIMMLMCVDVLITITVFFSNNPSLAYFHPGAVSSVPHLVALLLTTNRLSSLEDVQVQKLCYTRERVTKDHKYGEKIRQVLLLKPYFAAVHPVPAFNLLVGELVPVSL